MVNIIKYRGFKRLTKELDWVFVGVVEEGLGGGDW